METVSIVVIMQIGEALSEKLHFYTFAKERNSIMILSLRAHIYIVHARGNVIKFPSLIGDRDLSFTPEYNGRVI